MSKGITSLYLDRELVARARSLGINLSAEINVWLTGRVSENGLSWESLAEKASMDKKSLLESMENELAFLREHREIRAKDGDVLAVKDYDAMIEKKVEEIKKCQSGQ